MSHENNGDDAEQSAASSRRRIWKRSDGQGSSQLVLAAMTVLYDAGEPLTRAQIAERLLPRLDAWARDYLQAWWLRRRQQKYRWQNQKRGHSLADSNNVTLESSSIETSLRDWLSEIFARRSYTTQTLVRHPDGRYEPGPNKPFIKTMDGKLVRYTPEKRRELEETDRKNSRMHLVQLEFKRAASALSDQSSSARAQALWFLLRRVYAIGPKLPLSEWELRREFEHLLRVADSRETQDTVIRLALEHLLINP